MKKIICFLLLSFVALSAYANTPAWQDDPGWTQRSGDTTYGSNMSGRSYTIQHTEQADIYNDIDGHTANVIHTPDGDVYQHIGDTDDGQM